MIEIGFENVQRRSQMNQRPHWLTDPQLVTNTDERIHQRYIHRCVIVPYHDLLHLTKRLQLMPNTRL